MTDDDRPKPKPPVRKLYTKANQAFAQNETVDIQDSDNYSRKLIR